MDRLIFAFIATALLSSIIWITARTKSAIFGTMFGFSLLCFLAFYTFQWGPLGEFEVKGLTAQAKFIREQRQQAEADTEEITAKKQEAEQILSRLRQLEECTKPRSLHPTPETRAALQTDPRGEVAIIVDAYDSETVDYGKAWSILFGNHGWGGGGVTRRESGIPPGVTLAIHKADGAAPYALHLRDILTKSGLSVTVPSPGTVVRFTDPSKEVTLLIGRRQCSQ